MYSRQPTGGGYGRFGMTSGPPPRDLLVLLGVLFVTFALQFFESTAVLPALLQLTPAVYFSGLLWQLATYPLVGWSGALLWAGQRPYVSFWFLISLLMIFWFGRDVYRQLGRRRFWQLLAWATLCASVLAVAVELVAGVLLKITGPAPFILMQGQHMLLTVLVAAFATMNRHATILLFFVLPVQAKWFLLLEILLAFMGFLGTRDLAGFLGLCTAVGITYSLLTPGGARRLTREGRLRIMQWWMRLRLSWLRRRRGMRVVKDDETKRGPWLH